ncbi:hypothetical protein [Paraburkholderia sediminicola]|uniref:hypothetical protein n=1 Tax=Paraburkholderia sediminicola TaxID=458836 RepID=UPI0038BAF080
MLNLIRAALIATYQTDEENEFVQDLDVFAKRLGNHRSALLHMFFSHPVVRVAPALACATARTTATGRAQSCAVRGSVIPKTGHPATAELPIAIVGRRSAQ